MIQAPNLAALGWVTHGFGMRDSVYPEAITTLRQIHSPRIVDACGRKGDRIEEGDALISGEHGLVIGVRTADCVPILLADRSQMVVVAVHAGWRGTAEAIVQGAIRKIKATPGDVTAAIGPCIGECCYEVGPEVARRFGSWCPELEQVVEKTNLDLVRANTVQLRELGVEDIWAAELCTCCGKGFHSYRRDRDDAGRMISYIGMV